MDYLPVEQCLQVVFGQTMPLSGAQTKRIAHVSTALLLAGEVHTRKLARALKHGGQQDSRVRWIQRLLEAKFMRQAYVYQPLVSRAMCGLKQVCWHLIIDRTHLDDTTTDLLTISRHYHKRAIPLVWRCVAYGGGTEADTLALIDRCIPLIPQGVAIIFHGDTEFGSLAIIRRLRELGWDFMLAQQANWHLRLPGENWTRPFSSLPVSLTETYKQANVEVFASTLLGNLNLMAFYDPHRIGTQHQRDFGYLVTSLPLSRNLKRIGRRRWGTEPFYKDYKSSGWHLQLSQLAQPNRLDGLLVLLACNYLWCVCLGRWLCKTGQRSLVDAQPQRHLSLFRIGWDWVVHQLICDFPCPTISMLYS